MIVSGAEIYDAFGRYNSILLSNYWKPISAANLKFSTSLGQFGMNPATYDVMVGLEHKYSQMAVQII